MKIKKVNKRDWLELIEFIGDLEVMYEEDTEKFNDSKFELTSILVSHYFLVANNFRKNLIF